MFEENVKARYHDDFSDRTWSGRRNMTTACVKLLVHVLNPSSAKAEVFLKAKSGKNIANKLNGLKLPDTKSVSVLLKRDTHCRARNFRQR